jgi:hypothetical protein
MKAGTGLLKSGWMFLLLAVLIVSGLLLLSNRKFTQLPADTLHAGLTDNSSCAPCHSPDGESPLSEEHPPKEQCLTCHKAGKK